MNQDTQIERIAALPTPDLSGIDGAALAMQANAAARQSRVIIGSALVAALSIGVAGGLQSPARAEAPLVPFGVPAALTPLIAMGQG